MGNTQSNECANKTDTENSALQDVEEDIQIFKQIAEKEGSSAMIKYIEEKINRWKKEQIKFAITGRAATGKSAFINRMRNLKPGDNGFAKTGSGDTTTTATLYKHPKNDLITFYDLPGYSTTIFKKEEYIRKMKMSDYHLVFIFFNNVLSEDEEWLVGELHKLGKPFCLVRSKIDIDIGNAEFDGKDQQIIIPEIKEKIKRSLQANPALKDTKGIFLISSRNRQLGEWSDLMLYITENIDKIKVQTLLFTLDISTKAILEIKYGMLKKRLTPVTVLATSIAVVPIPGVGNAINYVVLEKEVSHYVHVFGVDQERVNTLTDFDYSSLKCKSLFKPNLDVERFVRSQMETYVPGGFPNPFLSLLLPIVGSVISSVKTARVTHRFLESALQDIKDDAVLIYGHINKSNAEYGL